VVQRYELRGRIAATGFTSGDRVVIGMWDASPIGPFADVMWAEPDGTRVLHASPRAASFITAVYQFDRVVDHEVVATFDGRTIRVTVGEFELALTGGVAVAFPPRPPWVTRHVEAPLARRLMAVETFGTSPTGVDEWYRARSVRRVRSVSVRGPRDLGPMASLEEPCRFGFSEPPRFASITEVRPLLEDRSGRLAAVVAALVAGSAP
jgi:hypothetical protein